MTIRRTRLLVAVPMFIGTVLGLSLILVYAVVATIGHTLYGIWYDVRRGPPNPP